VVYDPASQILQINTYGTDSTSSLFSYVYDAVGNRWAMVFDGHTGTPVSWTYDARDRLINAVSLDSSAAYNFTYVYDSKDNIQVNGETSPPTTSTFDAASRLVTSVQGSATTTFTFDANGNRTTENQAGAITGYVFDNENREITVTQPDFTIITSTYSGDG